MDHISIYTILDNTIQHGLAVAMSSPHAVKGFADDITIISPSLPAHNCVLKEVDKTQRQEPQQKKTSQLRPQAQTWKDMSHWWKQNWQKVNCPASHGSTQNISEATCKVLGHLLAMSLTCSHKTSAKKLEGKPFSAIRNIDGKPIRGNPKFVSLKGDPSPTSVWILQLHPRSSTSAIKV